MGNGLERDQMGEKKSEKGFAVVQGRDEGCSGLNVWALSLPQFMYWNPNL